MKLKKEYFGFEHRIFIDEEESWIERTGVMKKEDARFLSHLSDNILNEMNGFIKRNTVVVLKENGKNNPCCCSKCLKAHLIKKAREGRMMREEKILSEIFKCETGHDGFYLDDNKVLRV